MHSGSPHYKDWVKTVSLLDTGLFFMSSKSRTNSIVQHQQVVFVPSRTNYHAVCCYVHVMLWANNANKDIFSSYLVAVLCLLC